MEYTECKDCKNIYKCEHTYIGGCSDGNPWEIKTIGTPEEFSEIMNKIKEEGSYDSFVNTSKDKDALIKEMLFDIGPTMTVNYNGKEQQVIFYPKESLAKVLIARGWIKTDLEQLNQKTVKNTITQIKQFLNGVETVRGDDENKLQPEIGYKCSEVDDFLGKLENNSVLK